MVLYADDIMIIALKEEFLRNIFGKLKKSAKDN